MAALVLLERKEKEILFVDRDDLRTVVLTSAPAVVRYDGRGYLFQGSRQLLQIFASLGAGDEVHVAFDLDDRGRLWRWMVAGAAASARLSAPLFDAPALPLLPERLADAFSKPEPLRPGEEGRNLYIRSLFYRHLSTYLQRFLGTVQGPGGLPLTYESLTALFFIAEREEEIIAYPAVREWRLIGQPAGGDIEASLQPLLNNGHSRPCSSGEDAESFVRSLQQGPLRVESCRDQDRALPPPSPYVLPELVSEAQSTRNYSAKTVLAALRNLQYRRDRQAKSDPLIGPIVGGDRFSGSGILPLRQELTAQECATFGLAPVEAEIYGMIRARAEASMQPAAPCRQVEAVLRDGNGIAYSSLWTAAEIDSGAALLLRPGEQITFNSARIEESNLFPVERYSYANIFVDLADFGISASPLHIAMLEAMREASCFSLDRHGKIFAGPNLPKVTGTLARVFPSMQGIHLCAYLEQTATEVTSGRKELDFALRQFDQTLELQGRPLVNRSIEELQRRRRRSGRVIKPEARAGRTGPAEGDAVHDAPGIPADLPPSEDVAESLEPSVDVSADFFAGPDAAPEEEIDSAVDPLSASSGEENTSGDFRGIDSDRPFLADKEDAAPIEEALPEEMGEDPWATTVAGEEAEPAGATSSENIPAAPSAGAARTCPVCERSMVRGQNPQGGYWSCTRFPTCRHVEPDGEEEPQLACPVCEAGVLQIKTTPAGKRMFVCPMPGCTFIAWSRLHAVSCSICGSRYLLEKKAMNGKAMLSCPRAGCRYAQPLGEPPAASGSRRVVRVKKAAGSASAPGKRKVRIVRRR